VVVAHGFGEHGGGYAQVARAVGPSAGVDLVALDFRGHGRSPGRRGVVRRYDELTGDLLAAFDWAGREWPGLPRFVLGHSTGGLVALRAALDPRAGPRIAGLIVSNPSLRLAVRVPGYKLRLGRFLLRHAPWVTLGVRLESDKLTRDPVMRRERDSDPLCHGRISAPLFFGMVEGGHQLADRAGEVRNPVLMILGGSDLVIDPAASRAFFDRMGSLDKTLLLFPGMLHEPFNELGREQVFADVTAWLDQHLPPEAGN
jgi:alpha-beta hydrolase superfamily lysophospholipase